MMNCGGILGGNKLCHIELGQIRIMMDDKIKNLLNILIRRKSIKYRSCVFDIIPVCRYDRLCVGGFSLFVCGLSADIFYPEIFYGTSSIPDLHFLSCQF